MTVSSLTMNRTSLSEYLKSILEKRQQRNPKYSLRAYARDLGISPGACSDFIRGHRVPGFKLSQRIAVALELSEKEAGELLSLTQQHRNTKSFLHAGHELQDEEFSLIANREHFAILNLMKTSNYKFSIASASERLGFSESTIKNALDRLILLNLVVKKNGNFYPTHRTLTTTHDIPSEAIKEYHKQNILHALDSLFTDPPSVRDITNITTATNPANIEKAKVLIRSFRRKLAKLLESGEATEVYQLNIQLTPVTRIKNEDN